MRLSPLKMTRCPRQAISALACPSPQVLAHCAFCPRSGLPGPCPRGPHSLITFPCGDSRAYILGVYIYVCVCILSVYICTRVYILDVRMCVIYIRCVYTYVRVYV